MLARDRCGAASFPLVEAASARRRRRRDADATRSEHGRQVVRARRGNLACVFAHVGSYVPADAAEVPLLDRVFARVGSADDPRAGQSTFVREMRETAAILKNATDKSFVVVDEIGRGTSTTDGTALAAAVCETLCRGPLSIFTTHFYALCELEATTDGCVKNYHVDALVEDEELTLLYKVEAGPATKSAASTARGSRGFLMRW